MSKAVIRECHAVDIFDDPNSAALFEACARECADPGVSAVAPDRAFYEALEGSGSTRCFGVYRRLDHTLDRETLCGFAFLLLAPSGHNGKRYATAESLFVSREHRAGGAGTLLMEAIRDAGREAGCEDVFIVAHVGTDLARILFLSGDRFVNTAHVFRLSLHSEGYLAQLK